MYGVLTTLAMTVAAPVPPPAQANPPTPSGPAPAVVFLKANADGKVMVPVIREERIEQAAPVNARIIRPAIARRLQHVDLADVKDLTITTADGRKVELEEALKRLRSGEVVVVAADSQPVSAAYLKVFKEDTLVLQSPELVPAARQGLIRAVDGPVQIQAVPAVPAVPPQAVPIKPIQIQPAQPGKIQIQILPAIEAVPPAVPPAAKPAEAVPAKPIERIEKALPAKSEPARPDK